MLTDLVRELMTADEGDKEKAYRRLERVGVDRRTADVMVEALREEDTDERG